jgi:hypothetical protein
MAEREWTAEFKQEVMDAYLEQNPTPETTMDIVKDLAQTFEKTPNGVRMVLTKGGVYVKKEGAKAAASTGDKPASTRVNKAEAIANLKKAIEDAGKDVDADICDRLTGKAALYVTGLLG